MSSAGGSIRCYTDSLSSGLRRRRAAEQVGGRNNAPRALEEHSHRGTVYSPRITLTASGQTIDELASGALTPSAAPSMLGPINALGRIGWDCVPERTARTTSARDARLPDTSDR